MRDFFENKNEEQKQTEESKEEMNPFEGNYKMRIVGEVCIVVLGILFAILIYHWNETKTEKDSLFDKIQKELNIEISYVDISIFLRDKD